MTKFKKDFTPKNTRWYGEWWDLRLEELDYDHSLEEWEDDDYEEWEDDEW